MPTYKLLLIDPIGTLVEQSKATTPSFLPAAVDALSCIDENVKVALIIQAGGVGLRHWMESKGFGDNPEEYPTQAEAEETYENLAEKVGQIVGCEVRHYVSFAFLSEKGYWSPRPASASLDRRWSREWRMPNTEMIKVAMSDYRVEATDVKIVSAWDYAEQAAKRMECQFQSGRDFIREHTIGQAADSAEWAVLELMGHRVLGGKIISESRFGQEMLRIDSPISDEQWLTQYYGGSAIYCLTPCEESVARTVAAQQLQPSWANHLHERALSYRVLNEEDLSYRIDDDEVEVTPILTPLEVAQDKILGLLEMQPKSDLPSMSVHTRKELVPALQLWDWGSLNDLPAIASRLLMREISDINQIKEKEGMVIKDWLNDRENKSLIDDIWPVS